MDRVQDYHHRHMQYWHAVSEKLQLIDLSQKICLPLDVVKYSSARSRWAINQPDPRKGHKPVTANRLISTHIFHFD